MKKVKTSHRGRTCKYPCCRHILSIYNHSTLCYLHQDKLVAQDKVKSSKF